MRETKSILVAVRDGETGKIALERALRMAQVPPDRIHLVHLARADAFWAGAITTVSEPGKYGWLQALAESPAASGAIVEFDVIHDKTAEGIAEHARSIEADLIVVATHRPGLARASFIGSTALRILQKAHCPVLIARNDPNHKYQRALIAADQFDNDRHVVETAADWLPGAEHHLVHAYWQPPEDYLRLNGASQDEAMKIRSTIRANADAQSALYMALLPDAHIHVKHGFAESEILQLALDTKPDVLVVGKHRGSYLDERAIGSVAQFLLYTAPMDLLMVP